MNSTYPIVFIHGLLGSLQDPRIHAALTMYQKLAPDLFGYGHLRTVAPASITIAGQVDRIRAILVEQPGLDRVHLVGHSAGGVVAHLFAHQYPDHVASVVSVEGNFTLKDAFWSSTIARMPECDVETLLERYRGDRAAWLAQDGIAATPETLAAADHALSQQPAATVRAMAQAIVETTSPATYEAMLRTVFARTPVHLVAGERSRTGWDTPSWALEQAASVALMPGVGHLMTWENPAGFGALIADLLSGSATR